MATKVTKPDGYSRHAKALSYAGGRKLSTVIAEVFHYTGNKGDTAKNNADYFATGNTVKAGAHIFVSRDGSIAYSIPIDKVANAVGGFYTTVNGAGLQYKKIANANSVSIELCDCTTKDPSWEQMLACRKIHLWLKSQCPNLNKVVRHWDVNGKKCPVRMTGTDNKKWERFLSKVTKNYQYKAKVTKDAAIRSSKGVKPKNKTGTKKMGQVVKISKVVGNWGRLLEKDSKGRWQWISLKKVREL